MVKLTPDLSAVAQPEEWLSLSRRDRTFTLNDKNPGDGAVEAPFIMKHGDYYYLFVSFDYCCRGNNSDYKLAVGRSESAKGPYLDKEGNDMAFGGGTVFLEGNDEWAGVGHNSAYNFDGKDYMFFHGYYKPRNGAPLLLVREIEWDEEGWPVVNL